MSATAVSTPSSQETLTSARFPKLVFFDGECSFCNRWIGKVKDADRARQIRYGTKQGPTFKEVSQAHPEVAHVESIVLVVRRADGGEDFMVRSPAIRKLLEGLPEFRAFHFILTICPTFLSNFGYLIVSKLRKVLFSRWSHCRVPLEQDRELYID